MNHSTPCAPEDGRAPTGQALAVPATPASAVDGPAGFDPSRDTAAHARSDLQYIDGLEAHLDEGGQASGANIRDLIAMVRWNASVVVEAFSKPLMVICDQCFGAGGDNQHSICGKCGGQGAYCEPASGIEAGTDATTKIGAAEGPARQGDAQ